MSADDVTSNVPAEDIPADAQPLEDADAIKADIERTRTELAGTVEQVADRLNPKHQAAHLADSAKPHRGQILAALGASVLVVVVLRRVRSRRVSQ